LFESAGWQPANKGHPKGTGLHFLSFWRAWQPSLFFLFPFLLEKDQEEKFWAGVHPLSMWEHWKKKTTGGFENEKGELFGIKLEKFFVYHSY
jgi:hypothetical protein